MRPRTMLILLSFLSVPALTKTFILTGELICRFTYQYNMRVIRVNSPQEKEVLATRKFTHNRVLHFNNFNYVMFPKVPESPPNLKNLVIEVIHSCGSLDIESDHRKATFLLKDDSYYHEGQDYEYVVKALNLTDAGVPHKYGYDNWGDKN